MRFFSPPENPWFTLLVRKSFGILTTSILFLMSFMNSNASTGGSPRACALRVQGGLQAGRRCSRPGISIGYWNARNTPARARSSGAMREQVLAAIDDAAGRDLVVLAARQDLRERALARAVRAHDGVHLAGRHVQRQALQDFAVGRLARAGSRCSTCSVVLRLSPRRLRGSRSTSSAPRRRTPSAAP